MPKFRVKKIGSSFGFGGTAFLMFDDGMVAASVVKTVTLHEGDKDEGDYFYVTMNDGSMGIRFQPVKD
jgi:hypothetical protein